MRLSRLVFAVLVPIAGCHELTGLLNSDPDAPSNLTYQLIPSGDPATPLGVLLSWDVPRSGRATAFNVYGRGPSGPWQLRATTTSPTFHDLGMPDQQYYVATRDDSGGEIGHTPVLTIDLEARLPAPQGLTSMSLNGAVQLSWNDDAVSLMSGAFDHYRVYSTNYDATRGVCAAGWILEGATVSDAFLAGNLTNALSRCFAVSAVTHDGHESVWSDARIDTPRSSARNAILYATAARRDSSGFLFLDDVSRKLGVVASSSRTDLDFTIERRPNGTLWITPARPGATVALYAPMPVGDLSAVDRARPAGFGTAALQARSGYAYVFRVQKADGVHFAAVRVAIVTSDHAVLDWAWR